MSSCHHGPKGIRHTHTVPLRSVCDFSGCFNIEPDAVHRLVQALLAVEGVHIHLNPVERNKRTLRSLTG